MGLGLVKNGDGGSRRWTQYCHQRRDYRDVGQGYFVGLTGIFFFRSSLRRRRVLEGSPKGLSLILGFGTD